MTQSILRSTEEAYELFSFDYDLLLAAPGWHRWVLSGGFLCFWKKGTILPGDHPMPGVIRCGNYIYFRIIDICFVYP